MRRSPTILLALTLVVASPPTARGVASESLAGIVLSDADEPVAGAIVTVTHPTSHRTVSTYTDPAGRFRLPRDLTPARYALRVRRPGYRELVRADVDGRPRRPLRLRLARDADPRALAAALPANRWLALLLGRVARDAEREEVVRTCTPCHQLGDAATRAPRSAADWTALLAAKARTGAVLSPALRTALPGAADGAWSHDAVDAAIGRHELAPPPPPVQAALRTVVTEWPAASVHAVFRDVALHPDGRVYATDAADDRLARLDPATGGIETWDVPAGNAPVGGVLAATGLAGSTTAHVAPHGLAIAPDGAVWTALCFANQLARFEPASAAWTTVPLGEGFCPDALRIDARGRLWYTLAYSPAIGMLDPATGMQRTFRLPTRSWLQRLGGLAAMRTPTTESTALPGPGLDVAADGAVWFSQPRLRRVGRLDPEKGAIRTVDTPFPAPQALRFDAKGRLWMVGFGAGIVARLDPTIDRFETWRLPTEPPGTETANAVQIDRRTDTVWITGAASDSLIRFEPDYARFTVFPLPTRVTYTRALDVDSAGVVWTVSANDPASAIDAPGPAIIRVEPDALTPPSPSASAPPMEEP